MNKLTEGARKLYVELLNADNPTQLLSDYYSSCKGNTQDELNTNVHDLCKLGFIKIPMWADNKPYHVIVNKIGDIGALQNDGSGIESNRPIVINDNSINIGNGNKIKNSKIISKRAMNSQQKKKSVSFYQKHPVICAILISFIVGLVLMFSFWSDLIKWIEGVF